MSYLTVKFATHIVRALNTKKKLKAGTKNQVLYMLVRSIAKDSEIFPLFFLLNDSKWI